MAEIGLIASVIQVAGAGLKLSQTLYQYADSVASADRRIKDIAKEVELTSFVIDELGNIFKADDTSALLSKSALKTADETVKECANVFEELEKGLKKSAKGKMGKWLLPFKESKMETLRAHVDKLKSTLQLLMQVLTHAYQVDSHNRDRAAEAAQRDGIKALLQTNKESTRRYEESLRKLSTSEDSTVVDDEDARDFNKGQVSIASAIASTITVESLGTCMRHVSALLQDIHTLQKTLSSDGEDISEHQQTLVGSYFRARGHLDVVLLGNPQPPPINGPNKNRSEIIKAQQEAQKKAVEEERAKSVQGVEKDVRHQVAQATVEDEKRMKEFERIIEEQKRSVEARIEATFTRGERLDSVSGDSDALARQAQKFYKEAELRKKEERDIVLLQQQNARMLETQQKIELEAVMRKYEEATRGERTEEYREEVTKNKYEEEHASKKHEDEAVRKTHDEEAAKRAAEEVVARKAAETAEAPLSKQQRPIMFKDALGRKFTFPFSLCVTWEGMHALISQAFQHVDIRISTHVREGHFDLLNADGEIIMPVYWDAMIQPGWSITMLMWPLPPSSDSLISTHPPRQVPAPLPQSIKIVEPIPKEQEIVRRPSNTLIPTKAPSCKKSSKTEKHVATKNKRDDKRRNSKGSTADKHGTHDKSISRFDSSSKHGRKEKSGKNKESVSKFGAMSSVSELDSGPPRKPSGGFSSSNRIAEVDVPFPINRERGDPFLEVYSPPRSAAGPHVLDDVYRYSPTLRSYLPTSSITQQHEETGSGDVPFQVHHGTFTEYSDKSLTFSTALLEDSFKNNLQSGESIFKDDAQISSHISSELIHQRQEEEVDELLREWTTVFH